MSWRRRHTKHIVIALIVGILAQLLQTQVASAVGFQSAYIRLDRMKINTPTGGLICANPTTTATERYLYVTFPSTYTLSATTTHWSLVTTQIPTGSTAWPGVSGTNPTNVNNTTKVVTIDFNSGGGNDLTPGTLYCFRFTDNGTDPLPLTTAGSAADSQQAKMETQTAGAVQIDYSELALSNIADDQIVVTAVVPPSFAFALSGNTDTLGTLSIVADSYSVSAGITATITTNAKGGWIAWAKDFDRNPGAQGLRSATASKTISMADPIDATPTTLDGGPGGAEGYGLDVNIITDAAGGCGVAVAAEYNGGAAQAGTFSNVFQVIADCTGTTPATANGDQIQLQEKAAIIGSTPAATDYTDTITVVAAGNF